MCLSIATTALTPRGRAWLVGRCCGIVAATTTTAAAATTTTEAPTITVKLWGAGGAGGRWEYGNVGGAGGFVTGKYTAVQGEKLTIVVGGGGSTHSYGSRRTDSRQAEGGGAPNGGHAKGNYDSGGGGGSSHVLSSAKSGVVAGSGGGGGAAAGRSNGSGGGGGGGVTAQNVGGQCAHAPPINKKIPGVPWGGGTGGGWLLRWLTVLLWVPFALCAAPC